MPTILLVEDDELIVDSVRYGLEQTGYQVLTALDGATGLALAREKKPDIVLLDVMLPVMDGFQVCRTLRGESKVPIIMLTARGEEPDKVIGLELGADDYVVKPFGMRELVARIRAQLRRTELESEPARGSQTVHVGAVTLDVDQHQVIKAGKAVELRPKEFDLLAALMSQPGHAFEREELLDAVWGIDWIGDTRTLDVHIRRLRKALEDNPSDPRYISTVRGRGYRFARNDEIRD
ncbi:MAG: winged helix-turn-helix domain-containing protein [Anaerolineae bacterium]